MDTQSLPDLPLPVPVPTQLRQIAALLDLTSACLAPEAQRAREMASKIEAREAADHGR